MSGNFEAIFQKQKLQFIIKKKTHTEKSATFSFTFWNFQFHFVKRSIQYNNQYNIDYLLKQSQQIIDTMVPLKNIVFYSALLNVQISYNKTPNERKKKREFSYFQR